MAWTPPGPPLILWVMQSGIMNWFRHSRRLPSLALLLAILAPVLLGLLPVPAIGAEQRLLNDISANICSPLEQGGKTGQMPFSHEDHCILCASSNHFPAAAKTPDLVITPSLVLRRITLTQTQDVAPPSRPDLRATAPRGPPTLFTI